MKDISTFEEVENIISEINESIEGVSCIVGSYDSYDMRHSSKTNSQVIGEMSILCSAISDQIKNLKALQTFFYDHAQAVKWEGLDYENSPKDDTGKTSNELEEE